MWLEVLWQLSLIIGVPWIIRVIVSFFSNKPQKKPSAKSSSVSSPINVKIANYVLMFLVVQTALRAFYDLPFSFYREIQVSPSALSFQVRNGFMDYCASKRASMKDFESGKGYKLVQKQPSVSSEADENQLDDGVSLYQHLNSLFQLLKINDHKKMYLLFGHSSFIECRWCDDSMDYLVYHTGSILWDYTMWAIFLVAITVSGSNGNLNSRSRYVPHLFVITLGILAMELGIYLVPYDIWQELFGLSSSSAIPLHDYIILFRRLCLAGIMGIIWVLGFYPTPGMKLATVVAQQAKILDTIKSLQLQQMALLEDEDLLRKFGEYHSKRQRSRQDILRDEALVTLKEKLMKEKEMEDFIEAAAEYTEEIISEAVPSQEQREDNKKMV